MADQHQRFGAMLMAQSLAFRCIGNAPDDECVARTLMSLETALGREDQLFRMVQSIFDGWRWMRSSPDAMRRAGMDLLRQVERATWPVAEDRRSEAGPWG